MSPFTADLVERAETVLPLLRGEERRDAERALQLCRGLLARAREAEKLLPEPNDLELKRELGGLVERLSRRSSAAIVLGTLGRAALADLAGDLRSVLVTCNEFDSKFALLGL
ncbi:MAG TPA: hypothetical protein VHM70_22325 [Polyangiaceae bacterium]|jgi:hypothetical protein|nr:hypothetical protein [Polyangiaceae bacterium]